MCVSVHIYIYIIYILHIITLYFKKMVLLHSNVNNTRLLPHQATKSLDTAHLAFQNENFQKQPLKLSPHEHTTIPKLVGTWISP